MTTSKIITTRSGSTAGVLTRTLMVSVLCLVTVVICTAAHDASVSREGSRAARYERISESLPAKCRQYYNDGTGAWAACIGVEPK